ncbi:MAG: sodium-dependent transporter [Gammaproteobacteria bacterium]|nr:sodium-dependent transporter [Gammaproteobacteria bacterium]MDH3767337.1 sodium-dependent transporter [Gammaproteobacteria bacterium]
MAAQEKRKSLQGLWSSRLVFILAVSGSAVGLGNIWKFPYIAGDNGGGAFVLVYLVCVFTIGLPIMMSEILIGRRGRRNPIMTMKIVGEEEAGQSWWQIVGISGVLAGFLILSFYSVVAGWALAYIFKSATGTFHGIDGPGVEKVFGDLTGNWQILMMWHTLFMLMTVGVVARGVQRGLEQAVRVLMPALVGLLLILFVYAINHGAFVEALNFMFRADFDRLTADSVLVALGHAFFTLSLGMGAVMAYGAYLPEGTSILSTSIAVVFADTIIALLAGMVIFPIVFAHGLDAGQGPGLIFQTLPLAFGQMTGGVIFGTMFFVLLSFAAWTSSIGLIEPAVAWLTERFHMQRPQAAWLVGGITWVLGVGSVLSFNLLADFKIWRPGKDPGTIFDSLDHLASNLMLPLGGLLIAVFAGWVMCQNATSEELDIGDGGIYKLWRFLTRVVAPAMVLLIFLRGVGLI